MRAWPIAASVAAAIAVTSVACAQDIGMPGLSASATAIVLIDSMGKAAAKPLNETIMLVVVRHGVIAPASIRAIDAPDGGTLSGLATWQSGGSVLFTSPDCTTGAHVHASSSAGLRASSQVHTPAGIVLHAGAIGAASAMNVRSILYDTGCSQVSLRQNGLLPVVATLNLSVAHPPPLSLQ